MSTVKTRLNQLEKVVSKRNRGTFIVWGEPTPEQVAEARRTGKEIIQIHWDLPRPPKDDEEPIDIQECAI
jgi:hypothetical protein